MQAIQGNYQDVVLQCGERMTGSYNTVNAKGSVTIIGNYNKTYASHSKIIGDYNEIYGDNNVIIGRYNKMYGANNKATGCYNEFKASASYPYVILYILFGIMVVYILRL